MANGPLRVIEFENRFHAVGCLIKGPHFVPEATMLNSLKLTKIWTKKLAILSFSRVFPNSSPPPHGLLSQSPTLGARVRFSS